MDWMNIVTVFSVTVTGITGWKYIKLKRDIEEFSAQMEESLDQVIAGNPVAEGKMEDTLFGKLNEKLSRVWHIFVLKGQENFAEKIKLQELVSDISHQSKIPLANQKIYLEILEEESLSKEGILAVNSLKNQTMRIDFLLESMIKLSRLETGVIQIKKEKKNLMDTIRLALSSMVPSAAKKNIALYITGEQTVILLHDVKWTMEAVSNLLDNAIKYTNENGKVEICVRRGDVFTEICVSDNGKGIMLERQAQIFQRFYREPEVHDKDGIGIGLYLTRKIIEMQDGYVDVVSRPDEGAHFRIFLPNF